MSAQLPRPSASAGAASGRAVIHGKIGIATQRQRERAILLAQVDKSREPAINNTRANNRAAPATPSAPAATNAVLQPRAAAVAMKTPAVTAIAGAQTINNQLKTRKRRQWQCQR